MNEWMNGCMNERTNKKTNEQTELKKLLVFKKATTHKVHDMQFAMDFCHSM